MSSKSSRTPELTNVQWDDRLPHLASSDETLGKLQKNAFCLEGLSLNRRNSNKCKALYNDYAAGRVY